MFHFLLGEVSCQRPVGVRPQHCEQRKLPAPGAWLQDPQLSKQRFKQWLADMRAAFPPGTKDAHLFGSRSHGNEADGWCGPMQPCCRPAALYPCRPALLQHCSTAALQHCSTAALRSGAPKRAYCCTFRLMPHGAGASLTLRLTLTMRAGST